MNEKVNGTLLKKQNKAKQNKNKTNKKKKEEEGKILFTFQTP